MLQNTKVDWKNVAKKYKTKSKDTYL